MFQTSVFVFLILTSYFTTRLNLLRLSL